LLSEILHTITHSISRKSGKFYYTAH